MEKHKNITTCVETHVVSNANENLVLLTDDTNTLMFEDGVESTPETLANYVSQKDLYRIYTKSPDFNERNKAGKALRVLVDRGLAV